MQRFILLCFHAFFVSCIFVHANADSQGVVVSDEHKSVLQSLVNYIPGLDSSFFAKVRIELSKIEETEEGEERLSSIVEKAKIYYKYPNNLHVRWESGKVIATNGRYVWLYNPDVSICAKQVVDELTGGLQKSLEQYSVEKEEKDKVKIWKFSSLEKEWNRIHFFVKSDNLYQVSLRKENFDINITFDSITPDVSLKSSLFHYKPPFFVRVAENILN